MHSRKTKEQEWSFEEIKYWLDILVKNSHPEPLKAIYY